MGDSIRGIGMLCGRGADREIEEFSEGTKIPHPDSIAHTEPGASEAEPGFKEEERRSLKQQNNL